MYERPLEMQRVGDDVVAARRELQALDDEVLARARVRHVADLGRVRVDERREHRSDVDRRHERTADGAAAIDRGAVRLGGRFRHGMREGAIYVGDALSEREIRLPRKTCR